MYELCHRSWKYRKLYSALLRYVSMSEEANIKLVKLIGKIIEQVNVFNYLGNMISYEKELDID